MNNLDAAIEWTNHEAMAIALWAADPILVEPLQIYNKETAKQVCFYLDAAHKSLLEKRERDRGCLNCQKKIWFFTDYRFSPGFCPSCGKKLQDV